MKTLELQREFIRRRANRESYRRISDALGISKSTCSKWEARFQQEIIVQRHDMLDELYQDYGMVKQARIERLGQTMRKIDDALDAVDFSKIPADRLLSLKLKYAEAMRNEYMGAAEPLPLPAERGDADNVYHAAADVFGRLRDGEITTQQSKSEIDALRMMSSAHDKAANPFANIPFSAIAQAVKLFTMGDDDDGDDIEEE